MKQRLSLTLAAEEIAGHAVALNPANVPARRLPAFDLPAVFLGDPPSGEISAVPLEPAAGILRAYPAFGAPDRQWLACINSEVVERTVAGARREFRPANQSSGNSARQSFRYLPQNTPI